MSPTAEQLEVIMASLARLEAVLTGLSRIEGSLVRMEGLLWPMVPHHHPSHQPHE
jgi:hypothetical protein